MKRFAPLAIFILLALLLCACGQTDIASVDPAPTPALSTKLVAATRRDSETAAAGTLPQLNTDDHIPYLTSPFLTRIMPDEPLKRGDAIEALYALLENPVEGDCSFSDVAESSELYEALCCMTAWGVVSDSAGEFHPNDMLSRAQLMTMLARFYPPAPTDVDEPYVGSFRRRSADVERLPEDTIPSFVDTTDHWAAAAIENAVDRGWIEPGGKFYPDAAVTRAEFCHILNRVLGRSGDLAVIMLSGEYTSYFDLPADHEFYADVLEASCAHEFYYSDENVEYWCSETLAPGFHRAGGRLYYVQEDGSLLRNTWLEQWQFDENGCYTTGLDDLDEIVRGILLEIGADNLSDWDALRAAFLYCTHNHIYIYHNWYTYGFDGVHDEFAFRARRFFEAGGGYCYDYAAGFGILARALGYNCYIVKAQVNEYYAPHGFVLIPDNGVNYIYDPELESARPARHADFGLFRITNHSIYDYWYTPWW